jgi:hypothetical protein
MIEFHFYGKTIRKEMKNQEGNNTASGRNDSFAGLDVSEGRYRRF